MISNCLLKQRPHASVNIVAKFRANIRPFKGWSGFKSRSVSGATKCPFDLAYFLLTSSRFLSIWRCAEVCCDVMWQRQRAKSFPFPFQSDSTYWRVPMSHITFIFCLLPLVFWINLLFVTPQSQMLPLPCTVKHALSELGVYLLFFFFFFFNNQRSVESPDLWGRKNVVNRKLSTKFPPRL